MAGSQEQLKDGRSINIQLLNKISGFETYPEDISKLSSELLPSIFTRERAIAQAFELQLINHDADLIEELLNSKQLKDPIGFAILTAGFNPPEYAQELGKRGEGAFVGFPATGIAGHEGKIYAIPVNDRDDYVLAIAGRTHPNEYTGELHKDMIIAHEIRVLKELARRQREKSGIDPVFFQTYLVGEAENHHMKPGEAAIILSDTEYANMTHPDFGPTDIIAKYLGDKFQSKMGRTVDVRLAERFIWQAMLDSVPLHLGSVVGTPGNPEFETQEEADFWEFIISHSIKGATGALANLIGGRGSAEKVIPLHGMGISAELANYRQKFLGLTPELSEAEFRFIALCLASDGVGKGSMTVDHNKNFAMAFEAAPKYMELILKVAAQVADEARFHPKTFAKYSLKSRFQTSTAK
jgi:hypothetical protein